MSKELMRGTFMKISTICYITPIALTFAFIAGVLQLPRIDTGAPAAPNRVIQSDANPQEQRLLKIKCPFTSDEYYMALKLNNDGLITGISFDGPPYARQTYSLARLEKGVLINAPNDVPVLSVFNPLGGMQLSDFHPARGGTVKIKFIKNALTKEIGEFEFSVAKEGNQWVALSGSETAHRRFGLAYLRPTMVHVPFLGDRGYGIDGVDIR